MGTHCGLLRAATRRVGVALAAMSLAALAACHQGRDAPAHGPTGTRDVPRETRHATAPVDAAVPPLQRADCAPLPATRPRELAIGVARHVVPHGAPTRREAAQLVDAAARCTERAGLCRVASSDVLDRLYVLAQRAGLDRLAARPTSRSPHYGSRYVTLAWTGGRCEVGESSVVELEPAGAAALSAVFDAVVVAFNAQP